MAGFSKKIGPGTNLLFLILIVLGFLTLINFLSVRHFTRFDLTQNEIYTLSASSKRIASELDDIVNIKCYFSKNLPPYVVSLKQQVMDMLDEYKAFAKGNIQVEFLDPVEDPALAQKMRFMGIPQVQMNILEKDQATSTNVYMGIAVRYEDKQQVIPFVRDASNLEYELTSSILKVSREEKKTVGFLTGHDEKNVYSEYQNVRKALERQYEIEKVDISEGAPVPSHINLLVVAGPSDLSERDKYELDQYIMRGGKVFFLVDIINVPQGSMQASYRETNLKDLLEHYGVRITKNLVLDRINTYISYQTGYTIVRAPYPFYPKIVKAGLDPNHPIVNQLESMMFPWVSALEVLKDTHEDLAFSVLAQSSEYSWLQKGMYNINPTQQFMPQPEDIRPYPLAVLVNGKFKSFYADKAIPSVQESDEEGETERKEEQEQNRETIKECAGETKILVVSNSRFLESNFTNQPGNLEFFLNAVDSFTWGKDLIGIRSRETTDRPMPILTERKKTGIRFANMMAVPLLVALFGVIRFYIRKKNKDNPSKLKVKTTMKLKNNLVLLIILIIFTVLVVLFEKPFQDKSKKVREDAGPLFSELQIDKVKKLQVKSNADTTVILINRDNDWFVVGEEEYPADPALVEEAIGKIQRIQKINLASKKKDKHTLFEVADGMATEVVLFGPKEKEIAHLYIGKSGPDLFSTYLRKAGSDEVFLHEEHLKGQFDREVNNWRDKKIFDFNPGGATTLRIVQKEETILLSKDTEENWHLEEPVSSLAEKAEVENILRAFSSLRAADFATKEEINESGIDEPTYQISVELKDGQKKTLLVGNAKGEHQYYAKNEEKKYMYILYKSTLDNLTPEVKKLEKVEIEPEEEKEESAAEKDASSPPPLPPMSPSSPLSR